MARWLSDSQIPAVTRLAFGAVIVYPVQDRETGYQVLNPYLPSVDVDPDGAFDFLYQINRPRDSSTGIESLRVNRLSRWSVVQQVYTTFELGARPGRVLALSPQQLACRLELDINTTSDFSGILPADKLPDLFQELVDLGEEIIAKGELP
jgi:hypothetical protein